jgi:hypothetical protein
MYHLREKFVSSYQTEIRIIYVKLYIFQGPYLSQMRRPVSLKQQ